MQQSCIIFVYVFTVPDDFFKNWDSLHATATTMHEVTRKRSKRRLQHTGNLFRKNLPLNDIY